jgi:hypothetical protein
MAGALGCERYDVATDGAAGEVAADSLRLAPVVGAFRLDESSGAAVSVQYPGVLYTFNDSGNDPVLYAFDTTGVARGRWVVRKTDNFDWEAAAVGRCAGSRIVAPSCVYMGDVGDNGLERAVVRIYRTAEPELLAAGGVSERFADSILVRYEDGPHNVEAMYVAPDGAIILIPKERSRSASGEVRPTRLYRVAPAAWDSGGVAEARLVDSLPIVPRAATAQQVTDASLSIDARTLAVRTYASVFLFAVDPATGIPQRGVAHAVCDIRALGEPQGEGVGIVGRRGERARLVLTSEGEGEPLRLVTCPTPPR